MIQRLTAIDVFAGCGGLTLGLKRAGFRVLAAIEIDARISKTYAENHKEVFGFADVRDVDAEKLLAQFDLNEGDLDLLAGCPPCQGFSVIRRQNKPEVQPDERNDLIINFIDLIEGLNPKAVMMENVPGLEKDRRFKSLCEKLDLMGYQYSHGVLNLEEYGVPQRRRRLVLLAARTGAKLDIHDIPKIQSSPTVRKTIGGLPPPEESSDPLHRLVLKSGPVVKRRIAAVKKDGGSRNDLPEDLVLRCHRESKTKGFNDVYGRMSWDSVAPTITGGCFNPSKGRFIHPEQDRPISILEASLLQSFPKGYKFNPNYGITANATMIGNALPPKFAETASKYIKNFIYK
ncbi:MAG: DNA cytosine methyltransferase [Bacteroidales bacterium]|nr:DNA cytosine methyltransferase [Bacteroidales bacterium]